MRRLLWVPLLVVLTIAGHRATCRRRVPVQAGSQPARLHAVPPSRRRRQGAQRADRRARRRPGSTRSAPRRANDPVNATPGAERRARRPRGGADGGRDLAWAPRRPARRRDRGPRLGHQVERPWRNDGPAPQDAPQPRRGAGAERGRSTPLEPGEDCSSYAARTTRTATACSTCATSRATRAWSVTPAQRGGLGVEPADMLEPRMS